MLLESYKIDKLYFYLHQRNLPTGKNCITNHLHGKNWKFGVEDQTVHAILFGKLQKTFFHF